jgi:hypothetical protein
MKQKLYCYVDETGQDTLGKLFIVVTLVAEKEREDMELFLEEAEKNSGKGKRKWIKSRAKEKDKYLELILKPKCLQKKIFYRILTNTKAYEEQTIIAIEQSIRQYTLLHMIKDYKATIVIDGLPKTSTLRVGSSLRKAGIRVRKVRGLKDESSALLRLTDIIAGLIRESQEKENNYSKLVTKLNKEGMLNELQP